MSDAFFMQDILFCGILNFHDIFRYYTEKPFTQYYNSNKS